MSVVNDVLKNIDQRRIPQNNARESELYYQNNADHSVWKWIAFITIIAISMAVITFVLISNQAPKKEHATKIALSEDLFMVPHVKEEASSLNNAPLSTQKIITEKAGSIVKPKPESVDEITSVRSLAGHNKTQQSIKSDGIDTGAATNIHSSIATETAASMASEKVISAVNSGNMDSAQSHVSLANNRVQNDVQIRMMMKTEPQSVLVYLKQRYGDISKNSSALALAAQGEQRSGKHESAIQIYKTLIPMQPNDARWRAGLAISLEALGDLDRAQHLYKLALSMNNLPIPLRRFSETRLASINH